MTRRYPHRTVSLIRSLCGTLRQVVKGSWLEQRLQTRLSAFYQQRKDIQIKQSLVQSRDDSNASDFTDYFGNSGKGSNYGMEFEVNWLRH